jgi:hypothetical protein
MIFAAFDMVSLRELLLRSLVGDVEGQPSTSTLAGPKAPHTRRGSGEKRNSVTNLVF